MRGRKTPIRGTSARLPMPAATGQRRMKHPIASECRPEIPGLSAARLRGARNAWIPDRSRRARDIAVRQVPAVAGHGPCRTGQLSRRWRDSGAASKPCRRRPGPRFCTASGSKLSAAGDQDLVAFEADEYDKRTRSGWSVLVNGHAQAVYEEAEIQRLNHLGLHPWVTSVDRPFWIRIRPASISGRARTRGQLAFQPAKPAPYCRVHPPAFPRATNGSQTQDERALTRQSRTSRSAHRPYA